MYDDELKKVIESMVVLYAPEFKENEQEQNTTN